jgi:glycosyltransferase involved in cell wall biosynthesis
MPKVSVITATYAGAGFLSAAGTSVQQQELPPGWTLEWIVQEDGPAPSLRDVIEVAGRHPVRYGAHGVQLGPAGTRNVALSRATGDLVQVLDHDDLLLPGATALLIRRFTENPILWAVGAADDLLDDGTRRPWNSALPFGVIRAGVVNKWAEEHGGNWPVHCAGLMMRTELVRALGGWAASAVDEDIVMFAALSEFGEGWNEESVTWLYRQHSGQTTRSAMWRNLSSSGRLIALQRVAALRHIGFSVDKRAALQFGYNSTDVPIGPSIKAPAPLARQSAEG